MFNEQERSRREQHFDDFIAPKFRVAEQAIRKYERFAQIAEEREAVQLQDLQEENTAKLNTDEVVEQRAQQLREAAGKHMILGCY